MKKFLTIIVGLFLILSLSSCSSQIKEGFIIDKSFSPAHTVTTTVSQPVMCGKTVIVVPRTQIIHYDDEWNIIIEGVNEEGEKEKREIEVSEETYSSLEIGDYYVMQENN